MCRLQESHFSVSGEGTAEVFLTLIYPTTELCVKTDPSKEFVKELMRKGGVRLHPSSLTPPRLCPGWSPVEANLVRPDSDGRHPRCQRLVEDDLDRGGGRAGRL